MKYPLSEKYNTSELMAKIMGPNPIKLEEELLTGHQIPAESVVCDLGSGQGLTSVFLAKEYGFTVYAADLWSDPENNRCFFREMGLSENRLFLSRQMQQICRLKQNSLMLLSVQIPITILVVIRNFWIKSFYPL